MANALIIKNRF